MGGKGRAQAKMKIMAKLGENLYRTTKVFGPMWEKQKARAAPRAAPRLRPLQHALDSAAPCKKHPHAAPTSA